MERGRQRELYMCAWGKERDLNRVFFLLSVGFLQEVKKHVKNRTCELFLVEESMRGIRGFVCGDPPLQVVSFLFFLDGFFIIIIYLFFYDVTLVISLLDAYWLTGNMESRIEK
jgi:hypothetical protein